MKNFFNLAKTAVKGITLDGVMDAFDSFFDILFLYGGFALLALSIVFDFPTNVAILGIFWMLIGLWTRQIKLRRAVDSLKTLVGHITVILATSEILLKLRDDPPVKITGKN